MTRHYKEYEELKKILKNLLYTEFITCLDFNPYDLEVKNCLINNTFKIYQQQHFKKLYDDELYYKLDNFYLKAVSEVKKFIPKSQNFLDIVEVIKKHNKIKKILK